MNGLASYLLRIALPADARGTADRLWRRFPPRHRSDRSAICLIVSALLIGVCYSAPVIQLPQEPAHQPILSGQRNTTPGGYFDLGPVALLVAGAEATEPRRAGLLRIVESGRAPAIPKVWPPALARAPPA